MRFLLALACLALGGCGDADAEIRTAEGGLDTLVVASDPDLRRLAAELLPQLSRRSGLELLAPVRLERRSRAELETYLREKLDEELPPERARHLARSYHLLGLAPGDLRLRDLLLSVYLEQVAGFYDPDSTALFVLDDQGPDQLRPLLLHELVHAVQDQTADLDALTAAELGNDRRKAAQAAIEGHATLVMMEHVYGEMQGQALDLSEIPDMADQLRPALESVQAQFPALAAAPAVVQESLLYPYLEGAGFVLALWRSGAERGAAFRGSLPLSTEQVVAPEKLLGPEVDAPTGVTLTPAGGTVLLADNLGQAEVDLLLRDVGGSPGTRARGWDGDGYILVDGGDGSPSGLVWASVWDDADARDAFVRALRPGLAGLPADARLDPVAVDGRPVAVLRVGTSVEVTVHLDGGEP